jgi:hypothetical protein
VEDWVDCREIGTRERYLILRAGLTNTKQVVKQDRVADKEQQADRWLEPQVQASFGQRIGCNSVAARAIRSSSAQPTCVRRDLRGGGGEGSRGG